MDRRVFWISLIAIHMVFMGKQLFFGNSLLQDSREYIYAAGNLLDHQTLYAWNLNHAYNPDWLTKRPVLYPAILALFRLLSFGSETFFFFIVYLFQNLISLLSIRMVLTLAGKTGRTVPLKAVLIYLALSLSQFIYANMVMSEIWLQFCLVSVVYILFTGRESVLKYLGIAGLLMAAMSLKPVMLFTAYLFPLLLFFFKRKQLSPSLAGVALLPLIFLMSVSEINRQRTGYAHYSSISNINLLHYNTYTTLMYRLGVKKADSLIDDIHIRAQVLPSYREEQELIRSECKALLRRYVSDYAFMHIRGTLFCVLDPGRFDITQFFGLPHEKNLLYETSRKGALSSIVSVFMSPAGAVLAVILLFNLFRLWVMIRFTFSRHLPLLQRLGLIMFPAYLLALTGPIGTSRFFMPLVPLVLLMFILTKRKEHEKS